MPKSIAPKAQQKSFFGDVGSFLGKHAGEAVGSLLGFRKGTKVAKMKRGGKAPHMVKGSVAAKKHMAALRAMRK